MPETEIERAARLAAELPEVEVSTWYGTPSLKVAGKGFVRVKEPGVLVVLCPLGLKEALIEAEPDLYFETPHYSGWPAMLVRLDAIDDERLKDRIHCAWAEKAPKKLVKAQFGSNLCFDPGGCGADRAESLDLGDGNAFDPELLRT